MFLISAGRLFHSFGAAKFRSCEIKAWKKFRPERDSNPCDTGAVLYQLSYQTNWELATLWVCNIPVEGGEYKLCE